MTEFFTYDDFVKLVHYPVSRETFLQLQNYIELLKKWQKNINLVSHTSISDVWMRHIIDSAQLIQYIREADRVADIGSGAGLPGIILAIIGVKNMTLVESDTRKAAFLKEAARLAEINISVLCQRIEEVTLEKFDIITARGFASIEKTFSLLKEGVTARHKILLLKGRNYESEISEAQVNWHFDYKKFRSITNESGAILLIENLKRTGS